ncbi:MAG: TetR/AcrR family transcriptional regulator, partial [bacterium]
MAKTDLNEKIKLAYIDFTLSHGKRPESVYVFMKDLKLTEADFYKYYTTFDAIESAIWRSFFTNTLDTIKSQEVFETYSSREKMLAFYFGLAENLKSNRSFVTYTFKSTKKVQFSTPYFLNDFKKLF